MNARYVLVGCIGMPPMPREHVFRVIDCGPDQAVSVGYMTADEAVERFGPDDVFMSQSHGMCPTCAPTVHHGAGRPGTGGKTMERERRRVTASCEVTARPAMGYSLTV